MSTKPSFLVNSYLEYDILDTYIQGLKHEVVRDIRFEYAKEDITFSVIGEKVEHSVLSCIEHECQLSSSCLLDYVKSCSRLNMSWYETNPNRYSDHFMEVLPIRKPYTSNPEKYANIFGNLASQLIGVIVGNIREDGLNA